MITRALEQLRVLADELARSHPGAAASLTEGMDETLTITRLCIAPARWIHGAISRSETQFALTRLGRRTG